MNLFTIKVKGKHPRPSPGFFFLFHHLPLNSNQHRKEHQTVIPTLACTGESPGDLPPTPRPHPKPMKSVSGDETQALVALEAPDTRRQLWLSWRWPKGLSQHTTDTCKSGSLHPVCLSARDSQIFGAGVTNNTSGTDIIMFAPNTWSIHGCKHWGS